MQQSESLELVAMLAEAFATSTGSRVEESTIRVYAERLQRVDADIGRTAVVRILDSARFFPAISEILILADELVHGPVRRGGDAWGDVLHEIRRVGYCGRPQFADPVVARIVERWGWQALCLEGDLVADRARFIALYDQLATEARSDRVSGIPLGSLGPTGGTGGRLGLAALRRPSDTSRPAVGHPGASNWLVTTDNKRVTGE
jgi:hypothetical protein